MVIYDVFVINDSVVTADEVMSEEKIPSMTRTQRRAARTTRRILDAARDVFLDRGLAAATIEEITDRADVGKGTFYIYFSSKTAAFETVVTAAVRRLIKKIRAAQEAPGDLRELLGHLVEAELAYHDDDPKGFRLIALARTLLQLNQVELSECAAVIEKYFRLMEKAVQRRLAFPLDKAQMRRIVILLANISSGYLSFEAFDVDSDRMLIAYRSVREAMIDAVVSLIQNQAEAAAGRMPDKRTEGHVK